VTVYGQNLVPLRIVFQGDTGIFFNKKQEAELLVKLKYKEVYKENFDSLYKFSINCSRNVEQLRNDYDNLNVLYDSLEVEANNQRQIAKTEKSLRVDTENKLSEEKNRKKIWRRVAIIEGSGLLLITLFILL
jgi:hypothetical protein